jgi:ABC-type transport system involved in cytochrome bd biosynthesis fused ATPase/permease subunit
MARASVTTCCTSRTVSLALVNVGFQAVTATGVVVLIAVSLFIMNPWVLLVTLLVFGSAYALIFARSRRQLRLNSIELTRESARRATVVRQAFAAIKELLVMRLDAPFQRQFGDATARVSRSQTHTHAIGLRPKYVLECLAAFALVTVALVLQVQGCTVAAAAHLPGACGLPAAAESAAALCGPRDRARAPRGAVQNVAERGGGTCIGRCGFRAAAEGRACARHRVRRRHLSLRADAAAVFEHLNLRIRAGEAIGVDWAERLGKVLIRRSAARPARAHQRPHSRRRHRYRRAQSRCVARRR